MSKKNTINELFKRLNGTFDTEEPLPDHRERFLEKLNAGTQKTRRNWWRPLSIAASIVIVFGISAGIFYNSKTTVNVDPEIENAQFYFTSLLEQEIEKVNARNNPENQQIIDDTMQQLTKLEQDYKQLEKELRQNGNNKQILHAMITNFQTRINLLQDVLIRIDEIENFKHNENETTII